MVSHRHAYGSGHTFSDTVLHVRVLVFALNPLEQVNQQLGVVLQHVGLQVRQCDQLIQQLDKENVVFFTEPPAVQLQKPEGER